MAGFTNESAVHRKIGVSELEDGLGLISLTSDRAPGRPSDAPKVTRLDLKPRRHLSSSAFSTPPTPHERYPKTNLDILGLLSETALCV